MIAWKRLIPASGWIAVATAAVILGCLSTSTVAQVGTFRLSGSVVDEEGNPVTGLEVRFVPEKTSSNAERTLKVNKKGKFAFSFFPYGKYTVELAGSDLFLKSMHYVATDASGLETENKKIDAHPETGFYPMDFPASQRVNLELIVADKAVQSELKQAVAVVEAEGELKKMMELYGQRDMEGVLAEADLILADSPDLGQAVYMRGVALWQLGRYGEAVEGLRKASELIPDQQGLHGVLGQALLELGDEQRAAGDEAAARATYAEAAEAFATDLAQDPGATASLINRAAALDRAGVKEGLQETLEQVIEVQPDNVSFYFRLAAVHQENGDTDAALAVLDRIPTSDAAAAPAVYNIAVKLFNEDDVTSAEIAVRKAIEIDPELPQAHKLLSRIHLDRDEREAAIAEIQKYLELAPDAPDAEVERKILESLQQGDS